MKDFLCPDEIVKAELEITDVELDIIKAIMEMSGNIPMPYVKGFLKRTLIKFREKKQEISLAEYIYYQKKEFYREAEENLTEGEQILQSPISDEDLMKLMETFDYLLYFAQKYNSDECREIALFSFDKIIKELNGEK